MTTKQCTSCKRMLPLDAFGIDRSSRTGRRSSCRECVRRQERARQAAKPKPQQQERNRRKVGEAWVCRHDPTQMYGGLFERVDVAGTLLDGYWPDGSEWEGAATQGEPPSLWRVRGQEMHEVGGQRRLIARNNRGVPMLKVVTL
jgi:hypothetical protein